ncbi:hypothetical protein PGTUg99_003244 [Puccinia graminis f. sp. tritici]|uniref:RNA-dependent RNA polymerase n=1 Tax=Puccinia graminis f. sp. tritici TaxID=56615 RepID=A0A5B0RAT8_PUCGR|nr:hypothetical protein PGTUg99_003244 [Puccinia graminis f. sp. tritici]
MEISIFNHPTQVTQTQYRHLRKLISDIVHQPPLRPSADSPPANFQLRAIDNNNPARLTKRKRELSQAVQPHWALTLPTIALGNALLELLNQHSAPNQHGFSPQVSFRQSTLNTRPFYKTRRPTIKRPDRGLIASLRNTPYISHPPELVAEEEEEEEDENQLIDQLTLSNTPAHLASIDYGRLTDHSQRALFRSEYQICFKGFKDRASVLIDSSTPQIIIRRVYQDREDQLTLIDSKTVNRIEADHLVVLLFLDYPPTLQSTPHVEAAESIRSTVSGMSYLKARQVLSDNSGEPFIKTRRSAFDDDQMRIASFASQLIRLTFLDESQASKFLGQCAKLVVPNSIPIRRELASTPAYTSANLARLNSIMPDLDLIVSFQLEYLLYSCLLNPIEIVQLRQWVVDLDPALAERILIRLGSDLTQQQRPQPASDDRQGQVASGHRNQNLLLFPAALAHKFQHAKAMVDVKTVQRSEERVQREGIFKCRTVTITPTSLVLDGPCAEQGNSILRFYDFNSAFIRVALREEDGAPHRWDRNVDLPEFFSHRYRPLANCLLLAGRQFEFLCYSASALRSHQAWFVCPFIHRGELITATKIRNRIGSFPKVINIPARYMARVGQAFTTTRKAVTLQPSQIKLIEDVERNGSVFTDGVGTISLSLAKKVEHALAGPTGSKPPTELQASCYQIRLGGYKGMLSLDTTLEGDIVQLRPSMKKFEGESYTLDIAEKFDRPFPAFLNRQLIKILEDLGISGQVFLDAQAETVAMVENSQGSMNRSSLVMERAGLGSAVELPQILKQLGRLMDSDRPEEIRCSFVQDSLDLLAVHCLRELKYNTRIPLPESFNLVGVADEDGCLLENQVFVPIQLPGQRKYCLKGRFAIARSPCLHPGDIQVVYAIGDPPVGSRRLASLVNCVVFPVIGKRSLPSCLAGGDLDGDLYTIITDPQMVPDSRRIYQPGSYESGQMKTTESPCTIHDGIDFFFHYILDNIVGMIANKHAIIADQADEGVLDRKCLDLAELHSQAVDYPKTGMAVPVTKLPRCSPKRPDFMCPEYMFNDHLSDKEKAQQAERTYPSPKILGQLFRAIPPEQIHAYQKRVIDRGGMNLIKKSRHRSLDPDGSITWRLRNRLIQEKILRTCGDKWKDEMGRLMDEFLLDIDKISRIDRLHKPSCPEPSTEGNRSEALTEIEILLGLILMDNGKMGKTVKKDSVRRLQAHTEQLFGALKSNISRHHLSPSPSSPFTLQALHPGFQAYRLDVIGRAWAGWNLVASPSSSSDHSDLQRPFGALSFGLVCFNLLASCINFEK